jgi:4-hydroxybenzoyl-CoA reductase subunit beta
MHLPRFELLKPTTVKETLEFMNTYRERLHVLAGGTEITGRMKHRLLSPTYVLSLKQVKSLSGIRQTKHELAIGATTKLCEITDSKIVADLFGSVTDAARRVAAPAIRNVATVAGNLLQESRCLYFNQSELARNGFAPCYKMSGHVCHAASGSKRCFSVYQGDVAPVLICLGARAKIEKKGSSRTVLVEELFTGRGEDPIALRSDELLTEILLPINNKERSASAYQRFAFRGSIDYPLASAAVFLSEGKEGVIENVRIVLGSAGAAPVIAPEAADTIIGKKLREIEEATIEQAASLAIKGMQAVDNLILPASYRRKVAAVMTKRAVEQALRTLREINHARHA